MKKKKNEEIPLLVKLVSAGLGLGVARILNLGILFIILFAIFAWIYFAPFLHLKIKGKIGGM